MSANWKKELAELSSLSSSSWSLRPEVVSVKVLPDPRERRGPPAWRGGADPKGTRARTGPGATRGCQGIGAPEDLKVGSQTRGD